MTDQVSAVVVEKPAVVDVGRVEDAKPVEGEESMAKYAARREAELRGEKPEPKEPKQEPIKEVEPAAAAPAAATEEDPLTQIEETHKAKKGISKRMGELTAEREAAKAEAIKEKAEAEKARAEAEAARKEAADAKAEAERLRVPTVPRAEDDPTPDRDKFDDPDEYDRAVAQHAARQELRKASDASEARNREYMEAQKKKDEETRQAQVQTQIAELHKSFNEKVEKAKTDYPDFEDKVTNNEKLTLRNDVFFTIEKAELAPHILYHLASNPDVVESLNKMNPYDAAIRIGEMQAELRIARKPKPTRAADPIKPIGSRSSPERKSPDEMNMAEYAAYRDAEEQNKRKAKPLRH